MIGEQIGETKGKRLVRRVTWADPTTVEVTFEDSGHMLGVPTKGLGTYTSVVGLDGSITGEGQGLMMTQEGDAITWTAKGFGKFGPESSTSYRGMLFLKTASQKLARLNNMCTAFEYDSDGDGNTMSKFWEWK